MTDPTNETPLTVMIVQQLINGLFAMACCVFVWFFARWLLESVLMASFFTAVLAVRIATDKRVWRKESEGRTE